MWLTLRHIILIQSLFFYSLILVLSLETAKIHFVVSGLTRLRLEHIINHTSDEQANNDHSDVVSLELIWYSALFLHLEG